MRLQDILDLRRFLTHKAKEEDQKSQPGTSKTRPDLPSPSKKVKVEEEAPLFAPPPLDEFDEALDDDLDLSSFQ